MNIKKTVILTCIVVIFGFSCSKMNDLHEQYLSDGETAYTAKFDSLKIYSGKNRVKVEYGLSDPKAKKVCFYWNLRADSAIFDIDRTSDEGPSEFFINDLPEGVISFDVFNFDAQMQNRSAIMTTMAVVVYGEKYQSTLMNRTVKNTKYNSLDKSLRIDWTGSFDDAVLLELKYLSTDGEIREVNIPFKEMTSNLPEFMIESSFEYRVMYVPEASLDTFYTDFSSHLVEMPLPEVVFPETGELGKKITFTGTNLNLISEVWFDDMQGIITEQAYNSMTIALPSSGSTGEVDLQIIYDTDKQLTLGTIELILILPKFTPPLGGEIGKTLTLTGSDLDVIEEIWFGNLKGVIAAGSTNVSLDVTIPAEAVTGDVEMKVVYNDGLEMSMGEFYLFVKDSNLARFAGSNYPDAPALTAGKNSSFNTGGGRSPMYAFDGTIDNSTYDLVDYERWYNGVPNRGRTYWQASSNDKIGEIPNGTEAPKNHVWVTLDYTATLAGSVTFNQIVLYARDGNVLSYTIEISDDNLNWTKIIKAEDSQPLNQGTGTAVPLQFDQLITTKYVRWVCISTTTDPKNNTGLTNFAIYNTTVMP